MIRYKPVAVADRDGLGRPLKVEVAADLRHSVRILAPDGSVVGEVMADGTTYWDPPPWIRSKIAPASVRRALANGRFKAAVDERGVALCIRAEYRSKSGSMPSLPRAERQHLGLTGDGFEYFERPGGRILSVGGRPVRRWAE